MIPLFFKKMIAFIKRDLIESSSYRFVFFMDLLSVIAHIVIFFYVAKLLGGENIPALKPYGGHYFPFVLIGIALTGYQGAALRGFSRAISSEVGYGTLEAILITPTRLDWVVLTGALWTFSLTSLRIALYLFIGSFLFGADLSAIQIPATLLTLLLTITALSGLGLFSAGFILIFKKGDPTAYLLDGATRLFSGVYFPLAFFPLWLKSASYALPLTHSISAMRKTVLEGAGLIAIQSELIALLLFSLILLPLGILFFKHALVTVKKQGTLSFY